MDALGHNLEGGEGKTPTCEEAGYKIHECTRCDYSEKYDTDPIGHDWAEATCSTPETCANCGAIRGDVKNHAWGEIIVVTAPTCTEGGTNKVSCADCGATSHLPVAALGHTAGETVVENEVANDCVNDGYYNNVVYCTVCDAELSRETITVPAHGHSYEGVVTTPTCTEAGYTTYTCATCGDTYISDEVAANGHTVVIDEAVAPTRTETGLTEGSHCGVCGEILVAQTEIPALGNFVPGDANGDGKADSSDAVAILRNQAGYDVPNFNEYIADFNGDGKADSSDAVAILRKLAGY